jgi:hypothetical protein
LCIRYEVLLLAGQTCCCTWQCAHCNKAHTCRNECSGIEHPSRPITSCHASVRAHQDVLLGEGGRGALVCRVAPVTPLHLLLWGDVLKQRGVERGCRFGRRCVEEVGDLHICTIIEIVYTLAQGRLWASAALKPTLVINVRAVIRQCGGLYSQRFANWRVQSFTHARNT